MTSYSFQDISNINLNAMLNKTKSRLRECIKHFQVRGSNLTSIIKEVHVTESGVAESYKRKKSAPDVSRKAVTVAFT